jgi:hypothetical protein
MRTLDQAIKEALPSKGFKQIRERFLLGCENNPQNQNFNNRKLAVATQFNRDAWEIEDKFGKIRINKKKSIMPKLKEGFKRYSILPDGKLVEENDEEYSYHITGWFYVLGAIGDRLTKEEYEEMKKAYISDFPFDEEYLKSLNH